MAAARSYEWAHGLDEVITALVEVGLTISLVRETNLVPWQRFDRMVRDDESGWWRLPATDPYVPFLYAVRAIKA
jgi:hypothetical protein